MTLAVAAVLAVSACKPVEHGFLQGYVEGDYVYVAAPSSGRLVELKVKSGDQVQTGTALFVLEEEPERSRRDEARHRVDQAVASVADARKGKRPTELESLRAQLAQAQEAANFSGREVARQEPLVKARAVAVEDLDQARTLDMQNRQKIKQLEADLETAQLGSREDLVKASEAEAKAAQSALENAEWLLAQKSPKAVQPGFVQDTLYEVGEWVAAGSPVVVLLPPKNVKVRAYVPEPDLSKVKLGAEAKVHIDGVSTTLSGRVSFISSEAEYTPPVLYNRENRGKLVFMVEIRFDDAVAADLHPGQPVDIEIP